MEPECDLRSVPDDELLRRLAELLRQSRRVEADLVAHIGEVDLRRLYAREAAPSMFAYCTEVLHLSEAEAYLRIAAARASREHPMLREMLRDGRLHLTAIAKLAPHLTPSNRETLLKRAAHRSKRQIEELMAELAPRPDAPALMRKLPAGRAHTQPTPALKVRPDAVAPSLAWIHPDGVAPSAPWLSPGAAGKPAIGLRPDGDEVREVRDRAKAAGHGLGPDAVAPPKAPAPTRPASVEPLAPARYKVQFTASAELHDKLERLRALMRASVPDGDLGAVIEQAVTEKLERLESRRFARTKSPRQSLSRTDTASRHIPAAVRRAVHERDGGRCRFVDEQGRRCTARDRLEFHHRHPFSHGGDRGIENVQLLCRSHNLYVAEHDYGKQAMARHRRSRDHVSESWAAYGIEGLVPRRA